MGQRPPRVRGSELRSQEEGVGKEVAWKWGDGIHQGAATGVPPGILRCSIIGSPGSGAMGGSLGSGSHSAVPRGSLGSSSALPRGPLGSSSVMRRRSPASSDVTTPGPLGSVRAAWQGGALEGEGEHWDPEELSPTVTRGCPGLLGPSGSQCEAGIWQQVVEGATCRHRRSSRIWSISTAGFNRIWWRGAEGGERRRERSEAPGERKSVSGSLMSLLPPWRAAGADDDIGTPSDDPKETAFVPQGKLRGPFGAFRKQSRVPEPGVDARAPSGVEWHPVSHLSSRTEAPGIRMGPEKQKETLETGKYLQTLPPLLMKIMKDKARETGGAPMRWLAFCNGRVRTLTVPLRVIEAMHTTVTPGADGEEHANAAVDNFIKKYCLGFGAAIFVTMLMAMFSCYRLIRQRRQINQRLAAAAAAENTARSTSRLERWLARLNGQLACLKALDRKTGHQQRPAQQLQSTTRAAPARPDGCRAQLPPLRPL